LALQTLEETDPTAVGLLTLAAFLAGNDLPRSLLSDHANRLPELLTTFLDPMALGDAITALRRYSLVRFLGDSLFVHRLVQTVVRDALDTEAKRAWATAAVQLVEAGFPTSGAEVANWPKCQRLLPHALAAAEHARPLDIEPEPLMRLLSHAALYLSSRGHFREAETLFQQVVAARRRILGSDNNDTLASMNSLAEIRLALWNRRAPAS
jgi:hypothetical protein